MFSHNFQTLDNGLPVLRIPMPGVKSVTVLVLANTGSRYETPKQQGIAHFFEHMVFKGSQNYPSAQVLAATIDGVGADFNAFTSKEYTGYYVKSASRHVELALDVVSDMLLTPKLRQKDIDREKGVIIEEIHMYEDTPQQYVGNLFDRMAFASSGLEHDIIGSAETVSQITSADFQVFLKQWYGLANLLLVVAGDESVVGREQILKQIEEAFSKQDEQTAGREKHKIAVRADLKTNPFDQQLDQQLSQQQSQQLSQQLSQQPDQQLSQQRRFHLETRPTKQAHFVLGWPGLDRYDDARYALSLANIMLGGNMSSRLFTEVREKRGLAYYIRSTTDAYHDTGLFGAFAGVDPERINEALEVTINEFKKLLDDKHGKVFTTGELKRVKEFVTGKMALSYEDPQAVAQYYGLKKLLADEIESPDETLEKLCAVELDQVQQVMERLIKPGELRLALIGPFKDKAQFKKFLG